MSQNTNETKPHVILIFGDPNVGKSWLADKLKVKHGYDVLSIDEAYIDFVKEYYPKLYLESLNLVVSQHYKTVLKATKRGVDAIWALHIIWLIRKRLETSPTIAVEGYLLFPILKRVRSALSKVANVSVVYVKDRQYYLATPLRKLPTIE